MTDSLTRDQAERIFTAIGDLQGQVRQLTSSVIEGREESQREHRKVHDIVGAMAESQRVVAASVQTMAPHVERYRLKETDIDKAIKRTEEFHEARAEDRGAERSATKVRGLLYGFFAAAGATIAAVVNWALSGARPHP